MKKLAILFAFVLLLVPAVLADGATLSVDMLRYEPIPAQPGQYVTVYLNLENVGDDDAPRAALRVVNQFPFTTVSEAESQKLVGLLKSQESFVESFRVRVDSAAVVGTNKLKVMYTEDINAGVWQERDLNIVVRSNDATLTVESVRTSPDEVKPGEDMILEVDLKNTADIVLRNIDIELDLVETQGTTVVNYPFIPTSSSAQKTLTKLNPGEITTVTFALKAYPTATPGYYKLPVVLSFFDESGTSSTQNEYVGLIVSAAPELEVYFEESTLRQDSVEGDITLKFVNKGVNDLKFLEIELLDSDGYEIISSSKEYLGDLDSDDFRSETFTIRPTQDSPNLKLQIEYKDENNKPYSFMVETPLEYDRTTKEQQSPVGIIVVVVIVALLGFWIWRRNRHKKKK